VTGELGFVTEKISESDCEKKEAELGNVLQKIRVV
jgi:homoserine dehydrogenase